MESRIKNGALLNGSTVLHSEMLGDRCLILVADERQYVTAWLPPKKPGIRWEWLWDHYRQSGATALENFLARYSDAGGTELLRVQDAVREALTNWQKEKIHG
jgi:hypothetical protein